MASAKKAEEVEAKYDVSLNFPNLELHSAAASGNVGLVHYALTHGQPVNSVLHGVLPLHAACSGGSVPVVRMLIERGADVNAPRLPRRYSEGKKSNAPSLGAAGSTPLHFAAANGHDAIVQILLTCGAIADKEDKNGVTPEVLAEENGHTEVIRVLRVWQHLKAQESAAQSAVSSAAAAHQSDKADGGSPTASTSRLETPIADDDSRYGSIGSRKGKERAFSFVSSFSEASSHKTGGAFGLRKGLTSILHPRRDKRTQSFASSASADNRSQADLEDEARHPLSDSVSSAHSPPSDAVIVDSPEVSFSNLPTAAEEIDLSSPPLETDAIADTPLSGAPASRGSLTPQARESSPSIEVSPPPDEAINNASGAAARPQRSFTLDSPGVPPISTPTVGPVHGSTPQPLRRASSTASRRPSLPSIFEKAAHPGAAFKAALRREHKDRNPASSSPTSPVVSSAPSSASSGNFFRGRARTNEFSKRFDQRKQSSKAAIMGLFRRSGSPPSRSPSPPKRTTSGTLIPPKQLDDAIEALKRASSEMEMRQKAMAEQAEGDPPPAGVVLMPNSAPAHKSAFSPEETAPRPGHPGPLTISTSERPFGNRSRTGSEVNVPSPLSQEFKGFNDDSTQLGGTTQVRRTRTDIHRPPHLQASLGRGVQMPAFLGNKPRSATLPSGFSHLQNSLPSTPNSTLSTHSSGWIEGMDLRKVASGMFRWENERLQMEAEAAEELDRVFNDALPVMTFPDDGQLSSSDLELAHAEAEASFSSLGDLGIATSRGDSYLPESSSSMTTASSPSDIHAMITSRTVTPPMESDESTFDGRSAVSSDMTNSTQRPMSVRSTTPVGPVKLIEQVLSAGPATPIEEDSRESPDTDETVQKDMLALPPDTEPPPSNTVTSPVASVPEIVPPGISTPTILEADEEDSDHDATPSVEAGESRFDGIKTPTPTSSVLETPVSTTNVGFGLSGSRFIELGDSLKPQIPGGITIRGTRRYRGASIGSSVTDSSRISTPPASLRMSPISPVEDPSANLPSQSLSLDAEGRARGRSVSSNSSNTSGMYSYGHSGSTPSTSLTPPSMLSLGIGSGFPPVPEHDVPSLQHPPQVRKMSLSRAEAQEMVKQNESEIMQLATQPITVDSSRDLAAQLAAYGESHALEQELAERERANRLRKLEGNASETGSGDEASFYSASSGPSRAASRAGSTFSGRRGPTAAGSAQMFDTSSLLSVERPRSSLPSINTIYDKRAAAYRKHMEALVTAGQVPSAPNGSQGRTASSSRSRSRHSTGEAPAQANAKWEPQSYASSVLSRPDTAYSPPFDSRSDSTRARVMSNPVSMSAAASVLAPQRPRKAASTRPPRPPASTKTPLPSLHPRSSSASTFSSSRSHLNPSSPLPYSPSTAPAPIAGVVSTRYSGMNPSAHASSSSQYLSVFSNRYSAHPHDGDDSDDDNHPQQNYTVIENDWRGGHVVQSEQVEDFRRHGRWVGIKGAIGHLGRRQ